MITQNPFPKDSNVGYSDRFTLWNWQRKWIQEDTIGGGQVEWERIGVSLDLCEDDIV